MNLRTKILLTILTVSFILFGIIIGYISYTMKAVALNSAKKHMEVSAEAYANAMSSKFNYHIGTTSTYINAISNFQSLPLKERTEKQQAIELEILKRNPKILSVWVSWQLNTIDSLWNFDHGRQFIGMYRNENEIKPFVLEPIETNGQNINEDYLFIKSKLKHIISEPYRAVYEEGEVDSLTMVSILGPVVYNNKFKGTAGIDLNLGHFTDLIDEIKFPFRDGYAFVVSNEGELVAFKDDRLIGKSVSKIASDDIEKHNILSNIANGTLISFESKNDAGDDIIVTFFPVTFNGIEKKWSIGLVVPIKTITQDALNEYNNILIMGIIGLIIFLFVAIVLSGYITKPLIMVRRVLDKIAKGEILEVKVVEVKSKDEIAKIVKSTNTLIAKMKAISDFSYEMSKGNLHSDYEKSSKNDVLGASILEMQKSLIKATQENDKRREEDRKITWTTTGLAKFSELLRQNSNDVEEFSYSIISNLVEYLEANQGALFLINDRNANNLFIEKKGAYAYSNRKYEEQSFEMGVGLVGRCVLEKQTIYLTDIPSDYIEITSGLGKNTPKSLVLIPLKYNDVIYGVIEIASFKEIEDYQIAFLEKIGESIASSISGIKTNSQTSKLLDESQMQSEMLSSQEEEMRQNLEEMRATQEQLQDAVEKSKDKENELVENSLKLKKGIEAYERLFDSIAYPMYHKDLNGKYLSCNSAYAEVLGFETDEIIGRTDFQFLAYEDAQKIEEIEKIVIKDKTDESQKILFTTKAGHVFNGLQSKKVLYDKSNRLMGSLTILIPINVIDLIK